MAEEKIREEMSIAEKVIKEAHRRIQEFFNVSSKKEKILETVKKLAESSQWCEVYTDFNTGTVWAEKPIQSPQLEVDDIVEFITDGKVTFGTASLYVTTEPIPFKQDESDIIDKDRLAVLFKEYALRKVYEDTYEIIVPLPQVYNDVFPYLVIEIIEDKPKEDDP